jgi:hypothetical protein
MTGAIRVAPEELDKMKRIRELLRTGNLYTTVDIVCDFTLAMIEDGVNPHAYLHDRKCVREISAGAVAAPLKQAVPFSATASAHVSHDTGRKGVADGGDG